MFQTRVISRILLSTCEKCKSLPSRDSEELGDDGAQEFVIFHNVPGNASDQAGLENGSIGHFYDELEWFRAFYTSIHIANESHIS